MVEAALLVEAGEQVEEQVAVPVHKQIQQVWERVPVSARQSAMWGAEESRGSGPVRKAGRTGAVKLVLVAEVA